MNHPPSINNFKLNGLEDQSIVLQKNNFLENFIDEDNDEINKIEITKLPAHGNLKLSNKLITVNQEI